MALDEANLQAKSQPSSPSAPDRPVIIGLYGIPGCGKSYLLAHCKEQLIHDEFDFYEGSEMIDSLVPGGLDAFQKLDEDEKSQWRQRAIDTIAENCASTKRTGVVAGHFMFWNEGELCGDPVYTQSDLERYTHILYLNIAPEIVSGYRSRDNARSRPLASADHLRKWQEAEKTHLRELCRLNGILFSLLPPTGEPSVAETVMQILLDFSLFSEESNAKLAEEILTRKIEPQQHTVLVLDGDKTLVSEDTGDLFWKIASKRHPDTVDTVALKKLFSSPLGYSYVGFGQATLLYGETFLDEEIDRICEEVASSVTLRPEFASLLWLIRKNYRFGAIILTCGLHLIWDKILEKAGLTGAVQVMGGGNCMRDLVVTPEIKGVVVRRLRKHCKKYVWAFGDSPLDLPMLVQADEAIVVVGEERLRSKSMEAALSESISGGLKARQTLHPSNVAALLNTSRLPLVDISTPNFVQTVFYDPLKTSSCGLQLIHATDKASSKLLMTPMRDASIAGHDLREFHERVGWYLATGFVTEALGVEEYPIEHVQGNITNGYRLYYEQKTLIVPLMRGGEAMAFGVSKAFPLARFLHANRPEDIQPNHLLGIRTVILVDSVVNSGETIVLFVRRLRELGSAIRVMVVAGVVQSKAVSQSGLVYAYGSQSGFELIALRISDNKYTGSGGTDTGNRLFNTTFLS
ncbi:uracil phosphoribosyltransferase-domain-containing protein [Hypoxylon trugodes]|uniref:uracil phosphoribosyltransferase-domain-containing protein n=1 Tax=Hypoxylon trugodes TaxID=326681 RepID=UPI0021985061|nr:uracil phosphoribosyltransferase-domain-containing protein [Hypoxylon trugodes]KAI1392448.1 uracil phosphoribosyltransferase-domain-containing protein [Hypoxylon trugodes]